MTADHDSMEDAVAAYVLGACPDDERAVIRAHLDDCASCRELARRLREAVDVLALSCPGQVPPARIRRRILDAARSSRLPSCLSPTGRVGRPRWPPGWPVAEGPCGEVGSPWPRRRCCWSGWRAQWPGTSVSSKSWTVALQPTSCKGPGRWPRPGAA